MKLFNAFVLFAFILVSAVGQRSLAQTNSTIRTGRPGQAIGAYVVGTEIFQVQSGLDYGSLISDTSSEHFGVLSSVLRYGLSERFELSALISFMNDHQSGSVVPSTSETKSGISDLHLGFRINLIDKPDGWKPGLGLQTRFRTTFVNPDFRSKNLAPILILATNNKLSSSMALATNFGVSYDGSTAIPAYLYVINVSRSFAESWGAFVEVYGRSKSSIGSVYADTGVAYSVNSDLQFDLYGGGGRNHGVTDTFVSVGISWRKTPNSDSFKPEAERVLLEK